MLVFFANSSARQVRRKHNTVETRLRWGWLRQANIDLLSLVIGLAVRSRGFKQMNWVSMFFHCLWPLGLIAIKLNFNQKYSATLPYIHPYSFLFLAVGKWSVSHYRTSTLQIWQHFTPIIVKGFHCSLFSLSPLLLYVAYGILHVSWSWALSSILFHCDPICCSSCLDDLQLFLGLSHFLFPWGFQKKAKAYLVARRKQPSY